MERRRLGSSGLEVGAIGLGCMGMSWAYGAANGDESIRVIRRALDLGATLLDTADVYGPFTNEELVGRAIAGRDDAVVATKCGLIAEGVERTIVGHDGRAEHVREACEGSLRRLGIETIDLYYLHRVDPAVPVEETVGAMTELVAAGKVRALGLSEVDVPTLARAAAVHRFAAVQSELSLWTRDPLENGVVGWCAEHDAAFVPFSPLGRGFLTGRYRSADAFGDGDFRRTLPRFQEEALAANLALADRVREVAERAGATPAQVALAWVLAQGDHVIPIPGTKRLRYLEENLGAADVRLTAEDLAELDALPAPTGARYAV